MPNATATATTTASELTFGVEIECVVPAGLDISIGGYHHGLQVRQLPPGWKAERDSSIETPAGFKACEIVSPILKGADGLKQVMFVLGWLRNSGAKVNRSCGFHVHVGVDVHNTAALARVTAMVARHEQGLYAVTGTKTREEGLPGHGCYCKPIRDHYEFAEIKSGRPDAAHPDRLPQDRYCTLNLSNIRYGRRPAVEFRVFSGSLNVVKVIGWIRVCLGLVERAVTSKRSISWDLDRTDRQRARHSVRGAGKHGAMELVYGLNWKGGGKAYGVVECDGAPSTEAIVAELYRLAEKYDARDESGADCGARRRRASRASRGPARRASGPRAGRPPARGPAAPGDGLPGRGRARATTRHERERRRWPTRAETRRSSGLRAWCTWPTSGAASKGTG